VRGRPVGLGGRRRRYLLTVIPGDRQVDLDGIRGRYAATDAALAAPETAEALTGCRRGSIVPFSFDPDLHLLTDPALLHHPEIYFNAACLDRSVALATDDYVRLARPHLVPLAREADTSAAAP
jgi:Ala-tRNA(Pro) deacylase